MSDEAKIILKDMQIEEMRKEIISQDQFIAQLEKEYEKEIERLNNIINELEKEFDKTIKDPLIHMCYKRISREYYDKLQELKGSNGVIPPEVIGTNGESGGLFDYGDR